MSSFLRLERHRGGWCTAQRESCGVRSGGAGRLTLANYFAAYGSWRQLQALLNSLELGLGVAVLAGIFGVPMAWAISRTDMPGSIALARGPAPRVR